MHDSIAIPACFSSSGEQPAPPPQQAATVVTRSGQSVFMSVYKTHLAGKPRFITITWCKNLLLHGLSVSVQASSSSSSNGGSTSSRDHTDEHHQHECKVELKPWSFWRKHGSKQFIVDGKSVEVVWDLKSVKFEGETEPRSDYYVAIVCEDEVVLLLGDLKIDAYLRTRCRPALIEPALVSRREHVFGKKRFVTRMKFHHEKKGCYHEICLQCNSNGVDHEMEIRVDGKREIEVKHLQWKFRGNESMVVSNKDRVEVYWDVHDWLFGSGPRHGLFIFKPVSGSCSSSSDYDGDQEMRFDSGGGSVGDGDESGGSSSNFCLFLYAWKVE
ncbi:unnamed protein product [Linum tenue]|uniref:DUF868 family protein n=1 Tax=Linum tenue TaxID=586396 RepID=A0AAV0P0H5_9ROSI|nr:unnamed protein product [Linum tenue]